MLGFINALLINFFQKAFAWRLLGVLGDQQGGEGGERGGGVVALLLLGQRQQRLRTRVQLQEWRGRGVDCLLHVGLPTENQSINHK